MIKILQYQSLEINGNEIILMNTFQLDEYLKENAIERNETYRNKGFTENKSMRKICSIPQFMFMNEPLLKEYHTYKKTDPEYARKRLKQFLDLHPEYKTNGGSI